VYCRLIIHNGERFTWRAWLYLLNCGSYVYIDAIILWGGARQLYSPEFLVALGHGQLLDVDDIGDKQQIEGEEEDNSQSRLRNAKGRGRVRSMHRIFIPMTR